MTETRLDLVHALDRPQIQGIGRQTVKRIRRHTQHFARPNLVGGVFHQLVFRNLAVDFYNFGAHRMPRRKS